MSNLDALVRRVDEDRWLASRFAARAARTRLIALYALNYEIARTAETVTQAPIGDIRLAWWRDAVEEIRAGKTPRTHPVVQAVAELVRAGALPRAPLDALIEARGKDLDAAPFATWDELDRYVDATAGGMMRLASAACGAEALEALVNPAARAWGLLGLLRAAPVWRARGRRLTPPDVTLADLLDRARAAHRALRDLVVPATLFPALGYVALAPRYLSALSASGHDLERDLVTPSLISRQLTLVAASATGQF
ncbi:MAG: squalene/phytoene synthase family protein [Pseudomonadota bacterium]